MSKPGKHLKLIDAEIIRLGRSLQIKCAGLNVSVTLNEFESKGVASAHTRKLRRENPLGTGEAA